MDAEIIAIGSELLTPRRLDTNSLYLTDALNALGIEVVAKAVIGDDRARLAAAVAAAMERSEVVITTGGLGPTEDDVTRDAVAAALDRKLSFRQDLCDGIEERFRRMGRKMAEINRRQAFVIDGAETLANDHGTAPGLWIGLGPHRALALLPGPPRELKPMFERDCVPRLRALAPPLVIRTLQFRVTGITESDLDQLIAPVYTKYENPATTVLAAPGDIQVFLRARCRSEEEAERLLAEVGGPIEALLGDRIYARDDTTLEGVVGALLRQGGYTLAVAESCTGGMLAQRITSVAGASGYFLGGLVVYSEQGKRDLLGVPADVLATHGAVSEEVARAMASGAREKCGADYALAITGEAGPESATGQPVGAVFVGLATPDGVTVERKRWVGDRERVRLLSTQQALDMLRRSLVRPRC